jgi:hypothetical protein
MNLKFCVPVPWLCGLRRRSAAARLLRPWVRIPVGVRMFVCCKCCVLRRADRSPREVPPTVLRRCVLSRNLVNEEGLARLGLLRQMKETSSVRWKRLEQTGFSLAFKVALLFIIQPLMSRAWTVVFRVPVTDNLAEYFQWYASLYSSISRNEK